ncbi:MAG: hypothetical protein WDA24_09850 [Tissierellales bacterium]
MIIYKDYYEQLNSEGYSLVKPYFRIKYDNKNVLPYSLSEDFYIRQSNAREDFSEISDFIGRCYKDLHPSPETVKGWTIHRVFENNLWIWIMDKHKNIPAALGIAEFTTVSGEVDNDTNPERLYRSCGFYGDDVWWLLRKS